MNKVSITLLTKKKLETPLFAYRRCIDNFNPRDLFYLSPPMRSRQERETRGFIANKLQSKGARYNLWAHEAS